MRGRTGLITGVPYVCCICCVRITVNLFLSLHKKTSSLLGGVGIALISQEAIVLPLFHFWEDIYGDFVVSLY